MGLSLVQRFGTGVTIDSSNPTAPKLVIDLSDLRNSADGGDILSGQGFNSVTDINIGTADGYADPIAAALLIRWKQAQQTTNEDENVGIYIDDPYKQFVTRNGVEQLGFVYQVTAYMPDSTSVLDPDEVLS